MDCIKSLFGDAAFVEHLIFSPERHYVDEDMTIRLYHDMHTGKWWWNTQKDLHDSGIKNATIVPIIISTDQTKLTQFKDKVAYPVYLTIGNIAKEIQRKPSHHAHILLAYLPTTRLEHITDDVARRNIMLEVLHFALSHILQPLEEAGQNGIMMTRGNGDIHKCYPIYAAHPGDYLEHWAIIGIKLQQFLIYL